MNERKPFRFSIRNIMLLMLPVALVGWAAGSGRLFRDSGPGWVIALCSLAVPPMFFGSQYGREGVYQGFIVGALIGFGYVVLMMFALGR